MSGDGFQVLPIEGKGKGLFATKEFKTGDVIFAETPIVSCQFAWNAACGYLCCNHCMKPLETAQQSAQRLMKNPNLLMMYPECSLIDTPTHTSCPACGVSYCSDECCETAFAHYHKSMCLGTTERNETHPLEILENAWKQMHYPPETANVMLLIRMISYVQQSNHPGETVQKFMTFCHKTVDNTNQMAHKMLGDKFVEQLSLLRELVINAVSSKDVEQWLSPEGFTSLFAIVGRNAQGVGSSAISQWLRKVNEMTLDEGSQVELDTFLTTFYDELENETGGFVNNEGSALYEIQSAINHSCVPNAECTFPYGNHKIELVALKDINSQEEIIISYLDECVLNRSRHARQKVLRENYMFECSCEKCIMQLHDPDVTSESEMETDSD